MRPCRMLPARAARAGYIQGWPLPLSSYEIRGGRGAQIWPPFGPGVTYGPNNRGISSLWGARTAETAGSAMGGTGRAGLTYLGSTSVSICLDFTLMSTEEPPFLSRKSHVPSKQREKAEKVLLAIRARPGTRGKWGTPPQHEFAMCTNSANRNRSDKRTARRNDPGSPHKAR